MFGADNLDQPNIIGNVEDFVEEVPDLVRISAREVNTKASSTSALYKVGQIARLYLPAQSSAFVTKAVLKEMLLGRIFFMRTENIKDGDTNGKRVGHITMLPEESIKINSDFEFWLAEQIILRWDN